MSYIITLDGMSDEFQTVIRAPGYVCRFKVWWAFKIPRLAHQTRDRRRVEKNPFKEEEAGLDGGGGCLWLHGGDNNGCAVCGSSEETTTCGGGIPC